MHFLNTTLINSQSHISLVNLRPFCSLLIVDILTLFEDNEIKKEILKN